MIAVRCVSIKAAAKWAASMGLGACEDVVHPVRPLNRGVTTFLTTRQNAPTDLVRLRHYSG